ncbi:hypothetical protein [Oscillatoria acuminata]|uniref:hypothetical protein n=1 Tax=Oscillatoria acuminata TaxID=118323 RepID=UPI0012E9C06F|nr:hypothetical protein [Oscillatoria acuminata]
MSEMVQEAIAVSKIQANQLPFALLVHIPSHLYSQAKPWIEKVNRPAEGYNVVPSDGNWFDPSHQTWIPEPILLVQAYITGDVLQQHLGTMLQGYHEMGKALGEKAIALEIRGDNNNMMLIIPCD